MTLGAFLLLLPGAILVVGGEALVLRLALVLLVVGPAWAAVRRDLLRRGPRAVHVLEWDDVGAFGLGLGSGARDQVRLGHGSLVVGPYLWLVFQGRRRYPLFIDRRALPPATAAALLRSLRLTGRRDAALR